MILGKMLNGVSFQVFDEFAISLVLNQSLNFSENFSGFKKV